MKAAIYARVSTDKQAERATIDDQLRACRSYIEAHGWELVAEFKDDGVSGGLGLEDRPQGKALLMAAESRDFERVVMYAVDRFTRNDKDAESYNKLRSRLMVRSARRNKTDTWDDGDTEPYIHIVTGSFDGTPEGKLQFQILTAIAEYERRVIKRRTSGGRMRHIQEGTLYQAPIAPYGYRRTNDKLIELDPETAPIVVKMFEMAKAGLGSKRIALRLQEMGTTPPLMDHPKRKGRYPAWNWSTIHKILKNRRYVGEGSYGGVSMPCPRIIDDATFQAVQDTMASRKLDSPRGTTHDYLLQHLVYCGVCGSRYTPRTAKNGYVTYGCFRRTVDTQHESASHKGKWHLPGQWLEQRVLDFFEDAYLYGGKRIEAFTIDVDDADDLLKAANERLRKAESEVSDFDRQLNRLIDLHTTDRIDNAKFDERKAELDARLLASQVEIRQAREEIARQTNKAEMVDILKLTWAEWLHTHSVEQEGSESKVLDIEARHFQAASFEVKRNFLRLFLDRIIVKDVGKGKIELKFEGRLRETVLTDAPHEPTRIVIPPHIKPAFGRPPASQRVVKLPR